MILQLVAQCPKDNSDDDEKDHRQLMHNVAKKTQFSVVLSIGQKKVPTFLRPLF